MRHAVRLRAIRPRRYFSALKLVAAIGLVSALIAAGLGNISAAVADDASAAAPSQPEEYRIGPLDKLNLPVFELKDLTLKDAQVDASGQLLLPLIGLVDAQGKTARELSTEIASRLDRDYTQDAQVSVIVSESASEKVTVTGAVTKAGVFQLHGDATLLQAIAMAEGPSKTASMKNVTVFRALPDGRRQLIKYDAAAIAKGRLPDPPIRGNDVIIVAESSGKNLLQEATSLAPFLYLVTLLN
jgi:polysaccharide export outer membrane protein